MDLLSPSSFPFLSELSLSVVTSFNDRVFVHSVQRRATFH